MTRTVILSLFTTHSVHCPRKATMLNFSLSVIIIETNRQCKDYNNLVSNAWWVQNLHCVKTCSKGISWSLLPASFVAVMCTFFKTSNDIHMSPKHNQPPYTETHLSLRVDNLPREDQDAPCKHSIAYQSSLGFCHKVSSLILALLLHKPRYMTFNPAHFPRHCNPVNL